MGLAGEAASSQSRGPPPPPSPPLHVDGVVVGGDGGRWMVWGDQQVVYTISV